MSVEFRDRKWAIVASQHRSLRQAAEALNVRQSRLSRRLRDMESRLGAQLFERTNGGTRATVAGCEFLASARHILAEKDTALRKLQTRSRGENGRLTIGVYASLSTGNTFATLLEHYRSFPDVEVHTVDGSHDQHNDQKPFRMGRSHSASMERASHCRASRATSALENGDHPLA